MLVNGRNYTSIWLDENDPSVVKVIDQQKLPFAFSICELRSVEDVYDAIDKMTVRGAPLIGAAAAYGMYLASLDKNGSTSIRDHLSKAAKYLVSCRPTAVNLSWAVGRVLEEIDYSSTPGEITGQALSAAMEICAEETERCRQIGIQGLKVIEEIYRSKKDTVNILTHCNAGWLACIDYGTATAPVYLAREMGIPVHVWVDETRPRNQGAMLTAWEMRENGTPYTLVVDNAGGHLMQHGKVDVVMVGCDRATRCGDVANKIGTYLKALAAHDNNIPFYAVLPSSTIDFTLDDGHDGIIIEERDPAEVTHVTGIDKEGVKKVRICPENTRAANYGFDVTPARLVTGLITERGICKATKESILSMFPEKR